MPKKHVDIFSFDADGFFYNQIYLTLLFELVNNHYDFFFNTAHGYHTNQSTIQKELEQIYEELKQANIGNLNIHQFTIDRITNEKFKEKVNYTRRMRKGGEDIEQRAIALVMREAVKQIQKIDKKLLKYILIKANIPLFRFINASVANKNSKYVIVSDGSNRQSYFVDNCCMDHNGTPSFFMELFELQELLQFSTPDIGVLVNDMLMSDIYGDLPRGESLKRIRREYEPNLFYSLIPHAEYVFDETKASIIYATAHDALINVAKSIGLPATETTFSLNFGDDRKDILRALKTFYTDHSELLPDQVKLNLYQYDGEVPVIVASIQGTGVIDYNYRNNVKLMAKMCGHNVESYEQQIDIAPNLNVSVFLNARVVGTEILPYRPLNLLGFFSAASVEHLSVTVLKNSAPNAPFTMTRA